MELFWDLLSSKPAETVSKVYSEIEWVKAGVAKHPKTGATGLVVETEMEKFKCVQCGQCCLNLAGAYQTSVPESDIKLAVLVGTRKALAMAVKNQDTSQRQTYLKELLR